MLHQRRPISLKIVQAAVEKMNERMLVLLIAEVLEEIIVACDLQVGVCFDCPGSKIGGDNVIGCFEMFRGGMKFVG